MKTPIKPKIIKDISSYELFSKKDNKIYCIGSKELDRYFQVRENIKDQVIKALEYFDGTHTFEEIHILLKEKEGLNINVEEFYKLLQTTGLLENEIEIEKSEFERHSLQLFQTDISNNEKIFRKLSYIVPCIFILTLILIPFSVLNIKSNIGNFIDANNFKINQSYLMGTVTVLVSFFISLFVHESAHGIVARRYGLIPKKLIVSLYLSVSPVVYLKIPGLYTIKESKRIKVWIAGIYANLFLAMQSFFFMGYLHNEAFKMVFVFGYINFIIIAMNLWPFHLTDGYFILSTMMKIPNLRKKLFKELRKFIKGKENDLSFISFSHFTVSITFIAAILASQIGMLYRNFIIGYNTNHSILNALWSIKVYFILVTLVIINNSKKIKTLIFISKNSRNAFN